MGITNLLKKRPTKSVRPRDMIACASVDDYESKTPEQISDFVTSMISRIEHDHPLYKYVRSTFEYMDDGKMDFKFIMRLRP